MKIIYLIGFMGSGKSTIGQGLAEDLSKSYLDTDEYIERTYQRKIVDIFAEDGESVFRYYEIEALKKINHVDIVSTGGGIVEKEVNYDTMKNNGVIIYLEASFNEISKRLLNDTNRPLWNNNNGDKKNLFNRRIPLYEKFADYIIKTDDKTIEEIIKELKNIIKHV